MKTKTTKTLEKLVLAFLSAGISGISPINNYNKISAQPLVSAEAVEENFHEKIENARKIVTTKGIMSKSCEGYLLSQYIVPFDRKSNINSKVRYVKINGINRDEKALVMTFYLDSLDWHSEAAINNLELYLLSSEPIKVQTNSYEINVDFYNKTVFPEATNERLFLGDFVAKKIGDQLSILLEKNKIISREKLEKILENLKLINEIFENWKKEKIKESAFLIASSYVYLTEISYDGFGKFDENVFASPKVVRAPKAVEVYIYDDGEIEKIIGLVVVAKKRDYVSKGNKGSLVETVRVEKKETFFGAPLPLKEVFR